MDITLSKPQGSYYRKGCGAISNYASISPTTIIRHDVRLTYMPIYGHTVEEQLFVRSVSHAPYLLLSTVTSRYALILRKSSHWHAFEAVCLHIY